jgi:hypothetical protein
VDRTEWLRERRRVAEERFDTLHALTYDELYGAIDPTHRRFVAELLRRPLRDGHGDGYYHLLVQA